VDVATGSLGQGLSVACGMAYCNKFLEKTNHTFWCILGDGECAEGSVWEALNFGAFYKLNNLVAIIDCNRLGQTGVAMHGHDVEVYKRKCEAFGWNTIVVDGHSIEELTSAYMLARKS